jgi:hypothetical protein
MPLPGSVQQMLCSTNPLLCCCCHQCCATPTRIHSSACNCSRSSACNTAKAVKFYPPAAHLQAKTPPEHPTHTYHIPHIYTTYTPLLQQSLTASKNCFCLNWHSIEQNAHCRWHPPPLRSGQALQCTHYTLLHLAAVPSLQCQCQLPQLPQCPLQVPPRGPGAAQLLAAGGLMPGGPTQV